MTKTLPTNLTRGDSGKLRKCLHTAGFNQLGGDKRWPRSTVSIFSDARKEGRRLKLWTADKLFAAPQNKQKHLQQLLMKEFGKRYKGAQFIRATSRWSSYDYKSFCVYLSK